MGFAKFANASVVQPAINKAGWDDIRHAAVGLGPNFDERIGTQAQVILQKYDPSKYLLSHCSIIASVDTEKPGQPLGKQMFDGVQIDRKYPDYYITVGTSKYVNNNQDAWERKLLLAAYKTFIGAENYVEHIQIPELSKGKIIDAAARDIGDSIYVDILVATDKKHKALIEAITNGSLATLSMGCFVPGTPVTMADGRRIPIEEVAPGDMVLTHKGRTREVTNKQVRGGRWGMRRIEVVGVPDAIESTDNHPFFVLRPAKACACGCGEELHTTDADPVRRMYKRFKTGHQLRVLNPNGTYSLDDLRTRKERLSEIQTLKVEEVRADELKVGDYVILPKLDAETVDDPGVSRARLLGYFLAEGSFLKYKGVPTEVQFNFSLEEKTTFVDETLRLLEEAFPGCSPWVQDRPDRRTCTIHVYGRSIAAWFLAHGGEYSHLKRLSSEVMRWSSESQLELLGAWLNGDGCRHITNGNTIGTTTSYDLACQLQVISTRCGLPVRMECMFGGKSVAVSEAVVGGVSSRHEETGKLAAFNLYYPKSSSVALANVSSKAPTNSQGQGERHLRSLDNMVVFPITKIESFEYEGFVHDMEVEEDHSYLVHGLAVHNCHVGFTVCTKCGNVAEDELQLCRHIKYQKGNFFLDPMGKRRKIAELCGHIDAEPGSVKFIEGSWVANPAFTGAVLRNILDPASAQMAELTRKKIQVAFSHPTRVADPNMLQKAARLAPVGLGSRAVPSDHLAYLFDGPSLGELHATTPFSTQGKAEANLAARREEIASKRGQQDFPGEGDAGGGEQAAPAEPAEPEDPLKKVVDDLYKVLKDHVVTRVRDDISKDEAGNVKDILDENRSNESLIKSALRYGKWRERAKMIMASVKTPSTSRSVLAGLILHDLGGWEAVRRANRFSGREILVMSRLIDRLTKRSSMAGDARIYRTVIAVGGTGQYSDVNLYLSACRKVVGRELMESEKAQFVEKGRLYSLGL
jgi:hypothetical protein